MRSTMCFFNHTLDGDSLSAIVAFPYTEEIIKALSDVHIFALADQCNLISDDEKEELIAIPILRQRLLDTLYAVQDAPRMHAIFPCQSRHRKCLNLSSGFCSNTMCKLCCQVVIINEGKPAQNSLHHPRQRRPVFQRESQSTEPVRGAVRQESDNSTADRKTGPQLRARAGVRKL